MNRASVVRLVIQRTVILMCCTVMVSGTSLMKRIREKQTADDALPKGLEMTSENWMQVPQPVQDVLMSIDEKLKGLDTFSYTLKLARLDFSLEQLVRRMENIETKLGRLETKFDVRMEKVEEIVVSKDIKEEFSNEHLSRRMESLNDKINHKAAYLDAKLDTKLERIMNKLDYLDRDLHSSSGEILERLIKNDERHGIVQREMLKKEEKIDDLCDYTNEMKILIKEDFSQLINKHFSDLNTKIDTVQLNFQNKEKKNEMVLKDIQSNMSGTMFTMLQDSNDKIDNLSTTFTNTDRSRGSFDMCDVTKAITQKQLENLTAALEKALTLGEAKFKELDSDVELYARKVINGIQELWKTSDELKINLSHTLEQGSKTREIVRQEFRRLHEQIEPLPKLEPKLVGISEDLDRKVFELSTTVDNTFATLLVAQNTLIDSFKRNQQEDLMYIYEILQQIIYEIRNRSISDMYRITSELQNQSNQINKSLAHVLTAVLLTGNMTTTAVNDLILQLKQMDQYILLRADNINLGALESICSQLGTNEMDPVYKRNKADAISQDRTNPKTNYVHNKNNDQVYDNEGHEDSVLNDYDIDYKETESEYKDDI